MSNKILLVDLDNKITEVDISEVEFNPEINLRVENLKPSKKKIKNYNEFNEEDLKNKDNY